MNKYWATKPSDQIAGEIQKQFDNYQKYLRDSGMLALWRTSYNTYYKPAWHGGQINLAGEQGEFKTFCINHYKNLIKHVLTMITQDRPAFEPKATNTDVKSQAAVILSRGLLDYYVREKDLEKELKDVVEFALRYGEGFTIKEWDSNIGEDVQFDDETQTAIKEGDLVFRAVHPMDMARDVSLRSAKKNRWWIERTYVNKFDFAARFPEFADRITNMTCDVDDINELRSKSLVYAYQDLIEIYNLYHDKTDALPEGRIAQVVGDIVLLDGPMPYNTSPVKRLIPETIDRTNFGYTLAFDMLPLQEAFDKMASTILTNNLSFGVQNVMIPHGSNIGVDELKDGLNLLSYDSKLGKPEPLNLTKTAPETYQFLSLLNQSLETISGVNSVARGNPEAGLKTSSGSAFALIQSMAIQFQNALEHSYAKHQEEIGTEIINDLKTFANSKRTAAIVGQHNEVYMKDYMTEDLEPINRVLVNVGSPLSKTHSGKLQMAEDLLGKGIIKNYDDYVQVMSTGSLDVAIEGIQAETLNIKSENERLAKGEKVPVIITDMHMVHINKHKDVAANPEARKNPELMKSLLAHIQEHINMLQDPTNASILMLLGQQPVPPPQTPPQGPPQDGGGMPAQPQPEQDDIQAKAESVQMPAAPTNPLTGEQVELASGSEGRQ